MTIALKLTYNYEYNELVIQAFNKHSARKAVYEPPNETGNEVLGELWADASKNEPFVGVRHSRITGRRQGIGTKMYEIAAKWACKKFQKPLASDIFRSEHSDGFWQKQVRKNRAYCLRPSTIYFKPSAIKGSYDPEDRVYGRNGCERYVLNPCPAPKSLAGQHNNTSK